ncbi:glycerophosphodiester phosphodiesterase family protein [Minwuia thermotolerans]|uniref:Glycerophosphodiester phosphodiesterase n=1 Tax=Minwuia thermotolerans TaxID=2056226 RepID=A0A2M9FXT4_9PROT|nr:glycerophosphodiester phosphodiesterase family protein [Minwuia thermotolerans]PJK28275.1 glycerophosphodiester phosphodiesterase [Minwuia thermotolerans]
MNAPGWLTDRPIAHRGLHAPGPDRPENSVAALAAAEAHGYAAEIDVQRTADGEVVVFHDRELRRLCGVDGPVSGRRLQDLQRLRLLGGPETIPSLFEALDLFPDLPLLIELKMGDAGLAPAVAALLDGRDGPFAVQSFDPAIVAWFAENRPDWPRGLIAYRSLRFSMRAKEPRYQPEFIEIARPDFVAWNVKDLPADPTVPEHLPVITWTVRTPSDLRRARAHAANVIFEGFLA